VKIASSSFFVCRASQAYQMALNCSRRSGFLMKISGSRNSGSFRLRLDHVDELRKICHPGDDFHVAVLAGHGTDGDAAAEGCSRVDPAAVLEGHQQAMR